MIKNLGRHDAEAINASEDVKAKFWGRVNKTTACWLWPLSNALDYGGFSLGWRRVLGAHRAALLFSDVPYIKNRYACHTCPNRNCVKPGHLYWGTAHENSQDMVADGRHIKNVHRGEDCHVSKLSEISARKVIALLSQDKLTFAEIAKKFDVSAPTINDINKNKTWRHLDRGALTQRKRERNQKMPDGTMVSFTVETGLWICDQLHMGRSCAAIAKEAGICKSTVEKIRNGYCGLISLRTKRSAKTIRT